MACRNDVTPLGFFLGLPLPSPSRALNTLEASAPSLLKYSRREESDAAVWGEAAIYKGMFRCFGVSP